jgi:peptidoglycan/xylan/chitin deacetylase (PgdA/CDA1 family)
MYHHVCEGRPDPFSLSVSPANFAAHLEVLKEHAHPLSLQQLNRAVIARELQPRSVAITFDDGYASNLLAAKPLLQRHGIPATVFVTTGFLGSKRELWWDALGRIFLEPGPLPPELSLSIKGNSHRWELTEAQEYTVADSQSYQSWKADEEPPTARHFLYASLWRLLQLLPDAERLQILDSLYAWANLSARSREDYRGLSTAELTELAAGELIEIGAHTVTHPALPELSVEQQLSEIAVCKERLEAELHRPVLSFAYPYGANNADSVELVRRCGFQCACATVAGPVDRDADRFQLPRAQVCNWGRDEFYAHLQGWLEGSRESAAWAPSNHGGGRPVLIRGKWDLRVAGGNVAYLRFPDGSPDHVRIQIDALQTSTAYDIQLNLPGFAVISGCAHDISFRARADAPRKFAVGFAQAHEPWCGLGLYSVVDIDSEWRTFRIPLVPTASDGDARIHFDAGGDSTSVEVSAVVLHPDAREREI